VASGSVVDPEVASGSVDPEVASGSIDPEVALGPDTSSMSSAITVAMIATAPVREGGGLE
tara:strand:- start:27 stop:206 length:180 start_codon:yes stop_codon:yes gene_type:complete